MKRTHLVLLGAGAIALGAAACGENPTDVARNEGAQLASAPDDNSILRGDVESHDFGCRFEAIVAGDVIEHLSNPGRFLDNCRRHLEAGGTLLLTTPNAKWPTVFLRPNPSHALWHDRHTLRHLLERHGFRVVQLRYYPGNKPHYPWPLRLLAWRQQLLVVATPSRARFVPTTSVSDGGATETATNGLAA